VSIQNQFTPRLAARESSRWALERKNWYRVQSSGPTADEAVVCTTDRIYSGQLAISTTGWAGFKPQASTTRKKKPWLGPGLIEDGIGRIEECKRFEWYWR
jgi:hypothetical protein